MFCISIFTFVDQKSSLETWKQNNIIKFSFLWELSHYSDRIINFQVIPHPKEEVANLNSPLDFVSCLVVWWAKSACFW